MYRTQGSTRHWPSIFSLQYWPPLPLTPGVALVTPSVKGPLQLEKGSPWTPQSLLFFGVSAEFVRLCANYWSLKVKIINNIENVICIPGKGRKYLNNNNRPWKYHVTLLERRIFFFLAKSMFYPDLSECQTSHNLRFSPLPSTWSKSIHPSHSLPLKPILVLCHPLIGQNFLLFLCSCIQSFQHRGN